MQIKMIDTILGIFNWQTWTKIVHKSQYEAMHCYGVTTLCAWKALVTKGMCEFAKIL